MGRCRGRDVAGVAQRARLNRETAGPCHITSQTGDFPVFVAAGTVGTNGRESAAARPPAAGQGVGEAARRRAAIFSEDSPL